MAEPIVKLSDEKLDRVVGGRYTGPTFVYTLQTRDELYELATRYGTTLRTLLELNALQSPEQLMPGMRLLIPQK